MMRTLLMATALVATATAAGASTPESWAQLDRNTVRACIAMSGLARPQVLAQKVSFSDAIGTEVRLIRGTDSRGRAKRLLCARNRSTGRTEIAVAPNWLGAAVRP